MLQEANSFFIITSQNEAKQPWPSHCCQQVCIAIMELVLEIGL